MFEGLGNIIGNGMDYVNPFKKEVKKTYPGGNPFAGNTLFDGVGLGGDAGQVKFSEIPGGFSNIKASLDLVKNNSNENFLAYNEAMKNSNKSYKALDLQSATTEAATSIKLFSEPNEELSKVNKNLLTNDQNFPVLLQNPAVLNAVRNYNMPLKDFVSGKSKLFTTNKLLAATTLSEFAYYTKYISDNTGLPVDEVGNKLQGLYDRITVDFKGTEFATQFDTVLKSTLTSSQKITAALNINSGAELQDYFDKFNKFDESTKSRTGMGFKAEILKTSGEYRVEARVYENNTTTSKYFVLNNGLAKHVHLLQGKSYEEIAEFNEKYTKGPSRLDVTNSDDFQILALQAANGDDTAKELVKEYAEAYAEKTGERKAADAFNNSFKEWLDVTKTVGELGFGWLQMRQGRRANELAEESAEELKEARAQALKTQKTAIRIAAQTSDSSQKSAQGNSLLRSNI